MKRLASGEVGNGKDDRRTRVRALPNERTEHATTLDEVVGYLAKLDAKVDAVLARRQPEQWLQVEDAIRKAAARMPVGDPRTYEPEFRAPSQGARSLAVGIAVQMSRTAFRAGEILPTPKFRAGGDGSVYLHWKTQHGELMVSAPFEGGDLARFFGDTVGGVAMEGAVRLGEPQRIPCTMASGKHLKARPEQVTDTCTREGEMATCRWCKGSHDHMPDLLSQVSECRGRVLAKLDIAEVQRDAALAREAKLEVMVEELKRALGSVDKEDRTGSLQERAFALLSLEEVPRDPDVEAARAYLATLDATKKE